AKVVVVEEVVGFTVVVEEVVGSMVVVEEVVGFGVVVVEEVIGLSVEVVVIELVGNGSGASCKYFILSSTSDT
ncbi:hypothetical protein NL478_26440, partial [Klebsiella pneumoniae]|nr:hypothetical protein [Klebsiella pneumoniae]